MVGGDKSQGATEVTKLNSKVISNTVVSHCVAALQLHRQCGATSHHGRQGHKVVDITSLLPECECTPFCLCVIDHMLKPVSNGHLVKRCCFALFASCFSYS